MMLAWRFWRLGPSERRSLAAAMRRAADRLVALNQATEKDFLAVGSKLEDILARSSGEAGELARAGEYLSDTRGQQVADGLAEVLEWARDADGDQGCGLLLKELLAGVRAVEDAAGELRAALGALAVMGILTRMESARLGSAGAQFEGLAGEVKRLAAALDEKCESIFDACHELAVVVERTSAAEWDIAVQQRKDLPRLAGQCSEGLRRLRAEQERAAGVAEQARDCYRDVHSRVAGIVTDLQFHDATRQRIEHVVAGLRHLTGAWSGSFKSGWFAATAHTVELHGAQLEEARDVFRGSVERIVADLEAMAGKVAGVAAAARDRSGVAGSARRSPPEDLDLYLAGVAGALAGWAGARRKLAHAGVSVSQSCARTANFVADIEGIGIRMLWLARNAEIQAVRLEDSGAVMEAVAEGIGGLSGSASRHAANVGQALQRVNAAAIQLGTRAAGEMEEAGQRSGRLADRIRTLAAGLREGRQTSRDLLARIAGRADQLAGEITDLGQGITAHHTMHRISGECLQDLDRVTSAIRTAVGALEGRQRQLAVQHAERHYTMRAERQLHSVVAGGDHPETGSRPAPIQPASEFGDNVELF